MIHFFEICCQLSALFVRRYLSLLVTFLLPLFCFVNTNAQSLSNADSLFINEVNLFGNRLTKPKIILRELSFKNGSRIPQHQIDSLLNIERNKVLNTNLFNEVEVNYAFTKNAEDTISINISVREKWYFVSLPILEPADRSLTEWLFNRGASLNRLNYGFNVKHRNAFGLKQSITATVQFGFQRKFAFRYNLPFIDKKQRMSLSVRAQYDDNNTVGYITSNHRFVEAVNQIDDASKRRNPITNRVLLGMQLGIRRKFYGSHSFGASFLSTTVDDTVAFLNPSYFLEGRTNQKYIQLSYQFRYDRRDFSKYPLKGYLIGFSVEKLGVGAFNDVDVTRLDFTVAKYVNLGKELYFASSLSGKLSTPSVQPYRISRALGYQNNIVRGLDPFVVEGEYVLTFKNSLRFRAVNTEYNVSKIIPTFLIRPFFPKAANQMVDKLGRGNLMILPKVYFDAGYVKNTNLTFDNVSLSNKLLWGTGLGADIVILRSLVLRFEYSFSFRGDTNFTFEQNAEIR